MTDTRDTIRDGVRDTARDAGNAVRSAMPATQNGMNTFALVAGAAVLLLLALYALGAFRDTTNVSVQLPSDTSSTPTTPEPTTAP